MTDKRFSLDTFRQSLSYTPRTLSLSFKASRPLSSALIGLTIVSAALPLAIAYVGKRIVDAVVARSPEDALRQVLLELALVVGQAAVQRALGLVRQLLGARLGIDINVMILEKAQKLSLRHFEDPTFYDQLTRARREASSRPLAVVNDTFQLLQNVLTLVGYIGLLFAFSKIAVAGLLIAAIPATLTEMYFSTVSFRLRNWRSPETRLLNYVEHVLANDSHAKEVKSFGLGGHLLGQYKSISEKLVAEDQGLAVKRNGWAYGLSLIATGAFYACYAAMALAAAGGEISLGDMTLYVIAFRQGQQALQSSLGAIGGMYENNLYMSNLFTFLAIPVEDSVPRTAIQVTEKTGIRFEHVSFQYPGQDKLALSDINLVIAPGKSLALVGQNGAGKSTLIKLLTRLYTPTSGRILLDGHDLAEFDADALRRRIAVVFQDFNRYHFSVAENVGFGSIDNLGDTPRIERALERGGAEGLVKELPEGMSTRLGRWFSKGQELSGGQWQKLALARAFMRDEADILVLDEPTAALDAEAEYEIFERFRTLTAGRTTILISHRFPTVRMADSIVVIEGGKVREQGSHAELVAQGGRYAQLFQLQARGYL